MNSLYPVAGGPVGSSGTASASPAPPSATVTSVTVSPATATVGGSGQQQFSATVFGTNSPAQSVAWTATAGSINSSGLWTAPAPSGGIQTVTIRATSTVDTGKSGTATATVPAVGPTVTSVIVSPSSSTVAGGASAQFSATVVGTNSPSQAVTWSASSGSITSGGFWTAPATSNTVQTATITATSTLDGTKSGTATVTVPSFSVPTAPLGINAVAGMGQATLTITPPASNGGSAILRYQVQASTGQTMTTSSTSLVFSLPAFVAVSFTAQAINAVGPGAISSPSATVIPLPIESTNPSDYTTEPAPRERILRL